MKNWKIYLTLLTIAISCDLEEIPEVTRLQPTACFTGSKTTCETGCSINFDATCSTNAVNYKWDFDGNGTFDEIGSDKSNVSHTYQTAGTFVVELEVENAAGLTMNQTSNVVITDKTFAPPIAGFSIDPSVCTAPCQVTFTNTSQGQIDTYSWDFGDGSSSDTTQNPEPHTYVIAGQFTVTLIVGGPGGTDTLSKQIQLNASAPVAAFEVSATECYEPCELMITNTSSGEIDSYEWDFGDGSAKITERDPGSHTYQTAGTYTVSLKVSGPGGSDMQDIQIKVDATLSFIASFGGAISEQISSVIQTQDGGYALAGSTSSMGAGGIDAYLVKTNASGIMQWERTYGGTSSDEVFSVRQTEDGGFILAGGTSSKGAGLRDFYLIKTDINGIKVWEKTFGGSDFEWFGYGIQTNDGGYIMVGYTESFGAGQQDFYVVKTTSSGSLQWFQTYGTDQGERAFSVVQSDDGGYAILGSSGSNDMNLLKADDNGTKEWERSFGGSGLDSGYGIRQTPDGGYILGGYYDLVPTSDFYLIKTNGLGEKEWDRIIPDFNPGRECVYPTSDGGYILNMNSSSGTHLVKTNAIGITEWEKIFSGSGRAVVQAADGGYVVAGVRDDDALLIKTDANGNIN